MLPKLSGKLLILHLSNTFIRFACVKSIKHLLHFQHLKYLLVENCKIERHGFIQIIKAIATSKLNVLHFNRVHGIDFAMARTLAVIMTKTATLQEVLLVDKDCRITKLMVEAMKHSSVENLIIHKGCKKVVDDAYDSVKRRITLTNSYYGVIFS